MKKKISLIVAGYTLIISPSSRCMENIPPISSQKTPEEELCWATAYGDYDEVQKLLERGVKLNGTLMGNPPLYLAAANNQVRIATILIAHRANIHQCNASGRSPLDIANSNGHKQIVELLKSTLAEEKS